jgi:diguanylate cyclase (GGDEF)-like protein
MRRPGDTDELADAFTDPRTVLTRRKTGEEALNTRSEPTKHPVLFVLSGPAVACQFVFPEGATEITVGRGENATFRVADASVSRRHAVFTVEPDPDGGEPVISLADLGSTNGTRVNGNIIRERIRLTSGQRVVLGEMMLQFDLMTHEDIRAQGGLAREVEAGRSDPLTGLLSRRYLSDHLPALIRSHQRHQIPLSVAMVDADHFKRINDTLGHAAGDRTLRAIAELIRGRIRTADIPIRYGGEEFTVLLPGASREESARIGGRIRLAVARHAWDAVSPGLRVTVSIGLATAMEGDDAEGLVQRADMALYDAKRSGRDRIVVATSDPLGGGGVRVTPAR